MYLKNQTDVPGSKDTASDFYYTLNGVDSDYSGELFKQSRYRSFVETGDSIAKCVFGA